MLWPISLPFDVRGLAGQCQERVGELRFPRYHRARQSGCKSPEDVGKVVLSSRVVVFEAGSYIDEYTVPNEIEP